MKRKITTVIIILIIWEIASLHIGKEVILPLPQNVLKAMIDLLSKDYFYTSILASLKRVIVSILSAFLIGTSTGILAGRHKWFDDYFTIVVTFIQVIPQIAFILIFMVWFRSETALYMIILIMICPLFYHNARNGILNIDPELKDVIMLYHHPWYYNLYKAYLPLIRSSLMSAFDSAIPLALKVGVMAEVFVSSRKGIGHAIYLARVNIDMTLIFAWVIYMILLIKVILTLYNFIMQKK